MYFKSKFKNAERYIEGDAFIVKHHHHHHMYTEAHKCIENGKGLHQRGSTEISGECVGIQIVTKGSVNLQVMLEQFLMK